MVDIPPQAMGAIKYIASIFQVKPEWLLFPSVITVFALPLIMNIFMIYFILKRVTGFFPNSINMVLAGIIGFLMIPFNQITLLIAPAIIGFLGPSRMWLKIVVTIALYATIFLIVPYIFGEVVKLPF